MTDPRGPIPPDDAAALGDRDEDAALDTDLADETLDSAEADERAAAEGTIGEDA